MSKKELFLSEEKLDALCGIIVHSKHIEEELIDYATNQLNKEEQLGLTYRLSMTLYEASIEEDLPKKYDDIVNVTDDVLYGDIMDAPETKFDKLVRYHYQIEHSTFNFGAVAYDDNEDDPYLIMFEWLIKLNDLIK